MKNDITHLWSVLCQRSIVDTNTNVLSIVDVFETLNIQATNLEAFNPQNPVSIPFVCEVVTFWRKTILDKPAKGDVKLYLFSPKGQELNQFPVQLDIPENSKNFRAIVRLEGLTVVGPGEYSLEVRQKNDEGDYVTVARLPFDVNIALQS